MRQVRRYQKFFEEEVEPQFITDDYTFDKLEEYIYDIDKDVELVFRKLNIPYYLDVLKSFDKSKVKSVFSSINENIFISVSSSILKTSDCKEAHALNPIIINFGIFKNNIYEDNKNVVNISIGLDGLKVLKQYDFSWTSYSNFNDDKEIQKLYNYFSPVKIKASIKHELSHWLDDSLHDRFLKKKSDKAEQNPKYLQRYYRDPLILVTEFEINGQVHALSYVKKSMNKSEWNQLTFKKLVEINLPLQQIVASFVHHKDKNSFQKWNKLIIKRMSREGLLSDNMKNFLNWNDYKR
jgi:hypothetical protein